MFHVVLHQPEIPPNTGNIIRLCANTGCTLHLIEPLGFKLEDRQLRRAGLDYHAYALVHASWAECLQHLGQRRIFALTTKGVTGLGACRFQSGDVLLFGSETSGLPSHILEQIDPSHRIRLPMLPTSRSLNLSNSVAVVVYEAWRQNGYAGGI